MSFMSLRCLGPSWLRHVLFTPLFIVDSLVENLFIFLVCREPVYIFGECKGIQIQNLPETVVENTDTNIVCTGNCFETNIASN